VGQGRRLDDELERKEQVWGGAEMTRQGNSDNGGRPGPS
jgi:hypothetical protein